MILDTYATVKLAAGGAGGTPYPSKPLDPKTAAFNVTVVTRVNLTAAATVSYSAAGNWSTTTLREDDGDRERTYGNSARTTKVVKLPAGVSTITDVLTATGVDLWWPSGYGDQPLYKVDVSVPNITLPRRLSVNSRILIRCCIPPVTESAVLSSVFLLGLQRALLPYLC